jgi:predicted metal-dependent hydrolase
VDVEVIRSQRRRKTVEARIVGGVMHLAIPASMTAAEEEHWIDVMRRRLERKERSKHVDLAKRAAALGGDLGLPLPRSIEWSERQKTLWGSCTPRSGAIRVSTAVACYPRWVLDYVVVHELAHLVEPRHDAAFWELVGRYSLSERARGYLIAKGEDGASTG